MADSPNTPPYPQGVAPGVVEDVHVNDADAFLTALSPRLDKWTAKAWVFRGHANAEWQLQATGVRDPSAYERVGVTIKDPSSSAPKQLIEGLLAAFRSGLDGSGIVIPAPSPRVAGMEMNSAQFGEDPPPEAFPLMALAQHHGLPTPLLDWTRRPLVAAYFAAASALDFDTKGKGSHIAVWALAGPPPRDLRMILPAWGALRFYEAPGGTNPNLRAQSGIFTLVSGHDDPSVEVCVSRMRENAHEAPDLYRITLPRCEAPRLLRLLSYEGIHGAALFPGADGVVRSMRERQWWDKPEDTAKADEEIGLGLWEKKTGRSLTREIRDMAAFRAAMGDALFAGFAQLFSAVNRLDALLSLMFLNGTPTRPIVASDQRTAHDPDSTGANRNRIALGCMAWGVLGELHLAVDALEDAGLESIIAAVQDPATIESWGRLTATARRWRSGEDEGAAKEPGCTRRCFRDDEGRH
ncbi:MAG: FRG domain-containing protein [Polyangiaceae bacterium]